MRIVVLDLPSANGTEFRRKYAESQQSLPTLLYLKLEATSA